MFSSNVYLKRCLPLRWPWLVLGTKTMSSRFKLFGLSLADQDKFSTIFFFWESHSSSDRRKSRSMRKLQFALWAYKFWSKTGNPLIWIILEVKVNQFWIFNKINANQEIKFWVIKMKGFRGRKNIKQLGSFAVANDNSCGHRWVAVKTQE